MIRTAIVSFCLLVLLYSFQINQQLLITFKNGTNEDFKKIEVHTRDSIFTFYNLNKGQSTKPVFIRESYKYNYTRVITETDTLVTPGFCRVGEKLFTKGNLLMIYHLSKNNYGPTRYLEIETTEQKIAY
jgi:hypothetical protein